MRGQGFSSTHWVSRTFFLTFPEAAQFCVALQETFLERVACNTTVSRDECRVSNLTHCCDLIAVFVVAEDA